MATRRGRSIQARVSTLDRRTFAAVSRWHSPLLDAVMPRLSKAANHSALWMEIAAGLSVLPSRRARSGARRGLASVAAASLIANQVGKRLAGRQRPDRSSLPAVRRALRAPLSSSFPSGHSASAAAFAVGVAIDAPVLAIPIGAVAAAVAFSRVYTGMHYPSDVLAGVALGAGIAGLGGLLTPKAAIPASAPEVSVQLRARPTGAGVLIVLNPSSGGGTAVVLPQWLARELPDAQIVTLDKGDDLVAALKNAGPDVEVIGVAGGDGSVNAAAGVAIERGLPLLVIPAGTLNHFARDLGLDGPIDAIAACKAGTAIRADVGEVDGALFLNTASLGSYPEFVAARERWERRIGKPLAAIVAANNILRNAEPLHAEVLGKDRRIAALFVGAGRYQPQGPVPARRERLDSGVLDVRYAEGQLPRAWLHTVANLLSVKGLKSSAFGRVERTELRVRIHEQTLLARDGETAVPTSRNVTFRLIPGALTVYHAKRVDGVDSAPAG